MNDAPPPGIASLFTPDAIGGMGLAVMSSLIVGLQASVKGYALLVTALSAIVVTAVVLPLATRNGYTWGDWLGVVCGLSGAFAGTIFLLLAIVSRRALARGDSLADKALDRAFGPGEQK